MEDDLRYTDDDFTSLSIFINVVISRETNQIFYMDQMKIISLEEAQELQKQKPGYTLMNVERLRVLFDPQTQKTKLLGALKNIGNDNVLMLTANMISSAALNGNHKAKFQKAKGITSLAATKMFIVGDPDSDGNLDKKGEIINEDMARKLHGTNEKGEDILASLPDEEGAEVKGMWYYMDLSDPKDRNSSLVPRNRKNIITLSPSYMKSMWEKGDGVENTLKAFLTWKSTGAMPEKPKVKEAPVSEPPPSSHVPDAMRHEPLGGAPEIIGGSVGGAPIVEDDDDKDEEDELIGMAKNTIARLRNVYNKIKSNPKWSSNKAVKQNYLLVAAGKAEPEGKLKGNTLNLLTCRLLLSANQQKQSGQVFGAVNGRKYFGKDVPVRVAFPTKDQEDGLVWPDKGMGSRTATNDKLSEYVRKYVLQDAFNLYVQIFLAEEAAQEISSSGEGPDAAPKTVLPQDMPPDEYMRLLDDLYREESDTTEDRRESSILYRPEDDIGFPPALTLKHTIQTQELSAPGILPKINFPQTSGSTVEKSLKLEDTSQKLAIFEATISEFRENMPPQPTTVSMLRSEITVIPASEIKASSSPFAVQEVEVVRSTEPEIPLRIPSVPLGQTQFSPAEMIESDDED